MNRKQKKRLWRIIAAAVLFVPGLLPVPTLARAVGFLLAYLTVGYDVLWRAVLGVKNGRLLDESFLMAVASLGAIAIAVYEGSYDFAEAVAVMLLYQVGELFQSYAVGKSRQSIKAILALRPDFATVEREGTLVRVAPEEVAVGEAIWVAPGERVPLDGRIEEGESALDTAALTGESLPLAVSVGDSLLSGSVNLSGRIKVRVEKSFSASTVSGILRLSEEMASKKAKTEAFITRFARVYTPLVCLAALLLAVLPPLASLALSLSPLWAEWIKRALTFLVISCPCALVVSVPLTFFAAMGGAGRMGILFKGAGHIEALAKAKIAVLDKTGTLSQGAFSVVDIQPAERREEILSLAATVEAGSNHPLARSVLAAYGEGAALASPLNVTEYSGEGVAATVAGKRCLVGNEKLLRRFGIAPVAAPRGTVLFVAKGNTPLGYLLLADAPKPTASAAISALRLAGVERTVLLSGDSAAATAAFAESLGIKEAEGSLLPADKVAKVEALLAEKPQGSTLVFVGDGINDAPVLSRADIGIAMGGIGSDAAVEAADAVIMDDNPEKLAKGIRHAKRCMGIVKQNIGFSLFIKGGCLLLGALGLAEMWLAVFADVGVMVLAVCNALRAMQAPK